MSNGYHAQLNRLEAQIKQLTTECDELRAALKEYREQAEADYISLEEAYLQCQKDLYAESEQLEALRAKLESGVRVEVYRDRYGDLRAHQMKTSAGSEATLLIDDGVEI